MREIAIGLGLCVALAGCGDPLRDVPRFADVSVEADAGQAGALPDAGEETLPAARTGDAPKRGLLGFLKRKADEGQAGADVAPEVRAEVAPEVAAVAPEAVESGDEVAVLSTVPAPEPERKRKGLFGFLKRDDAPSGGEVELAAMAPERAPDVQTDAVDAPRERRSGGLFGGGLGRAGSGPKPGAPDFREVSFGTSLQYGEIARVCGVRDAKLGAKSESYPDRGRGYTLYDSAPGSTGAHSFYLTGFKDGCARQFTAALVIFGSPETWEQIHYGPAGSSLPVLATDRAFEDVKSRVCRVRKGASCGGRMSALAKDTVFVTFYERFEDNTRWTNILLHDGEVVAMDSQR